MEHERDARTRPTVVEGLRRRRARGPHIAVADDGRWVLEALAELTAPGPDDGEGAADGDER
jgi:hypothetical protein